MSVKLLNRLSHKQRHFDTKISPAAHRNLWWKNVTKKHKKQTKTKEIIDEQSTSNKIYLTQAK